VFYATGGLPANNALGDSIDVGPGVTVMFGTSQAVALAINSELNAGPIARGSARILATSKKLVCTAFLAGTNTAPPTSMVELTIVGKTAN